MSVPPGFFPTPATSEPVPPADGSTSSSATSILDGFTSGIKPSVNNMLIAMSLTGAMVPLLCALFLFSTSALRRKPVFVLNVFAVFMAMATGLTTVWFQATVILHPFDNNPALFPASVTVTTTGLVAGSVLVVRLVAVYPPAKLSWPALCAVYGPPFALKLARAVNTSVFLHWLWVHIEREGIQAGEAGWRLPASRAEFVMQMVDNSYMSVMFLWKLRQTMRSASQHSTVRVTTSYAKRIRTLVWIASSNFILPDLLSLAQLIFLFVDSNFYTGVFIMSLALVNAFVEVIGVLLATVWAASNHWQSGHQTETDSEAQTLTLPGVGGSGSSMDSTSVLRVEMNPVFSEKVAISGEDALDLGTGHAI